jgi:hypothetical protein
MMFAFAVGNSGRNHGPVGAPGRTRSLPLMFDIRTKCCTHNASVNEVRGATSPLCRVHAKMAGHEGNGILIHEPLLSGERDK